MVKGKTGILRYGKGIKITKNYRMKEFVEKFHPKAGDQFKVGREFILLVDDEDDK